MIDYTTYQIFYILSEPRKIQFALWYLTEGPDIAREKIKKSIIIPNGRNSQRIISAYVKDKNLELAFSGDDICIQSNFPKAIQTAVRSLLMSGEIIYRVPPIDVNERVFEYQRTYKRVTDTTEYHPINLN